MRGRETGGNGDRGEKRGGGGKKEAGHQLGDIDKEVGGKLKPEVKERE